MNSQIRFWNNFYKKGSRWKLVSKVPNICKGKVILELGVGNGKTLQSVIKQNPHKIYAVDFSKEAISVCKQQIKSSKAVFCNSDIKKLKFADKSFDIVIAYFILNNMPKNEQKESVNEINRVLKDGGKVLFMDFASGDYREKLFEKNYSKEGKYCYFFSKSDIMNLFSKFNIEKLNITKKCPIRTSPKEKRAIISAVIQKIN